MNKLTAFLCSLKSITGERKRSLFSVLCIIVIVSFIGCDEKSESSNVPLTEEVSETSNTEASTGEESVMYQDGIYEVETLVDAEGFITKATVTFEEGKIKDAVWVIYDTNRKNRPFDEKYEEVYVGNDLYIQQSRDDWNGSREYSTKLIETQDLEQVDAVSGATWTYDKFQEVMKKALKKAEN